MVGKIGATIMTMVEVNISLPGPLAAALDTEAGEQRRPRSALVIKALERYLEERESLRIMQSYSEAYPETPEEREADRIAWWHEWHEYQRRKHDDMLVETNKGGEEAYGV